MKIFWLNSFTIRQEQLNAHNYCAASLFLGYISRSCVTYCWLLLRFNILKYAWSSLRRNTYLPEDIDDIIQRVWFDNMLFFLFYRTLKRISPMFTFLWSDSVFHWFFWFVRLSFSSNSGNWSCNSQSVLELRYYDK